jgi:RNA polymerase sigma factor, sigma-70 family
MTVIKFEQAFLLLLIQQDAGAYNTFYLQTVDVFFRYLQSNFFLSSEDSEDIIADFYVKFRNAVTKYDINQSFSAYVRTIFRNTLKDYFKKHKELSFSQLDGEDEDGERFEDTLIEESEVAELLQQDFELEQIKAAMQELDALSREIIFLKYIEHKSNTEIEEQLLISQEVIRQRISRAFKKLRALLKDSGDI